MQSCRTELLDYLYLNEVKDLTSSGDKALDRYCILRSEKSGSTVYFLYNGNSLFMPKEWISVFYGFNVSLGGKELEYTDNKIDRIIFYMLSFIQYDYNGWTPLNLLSKICETGTSEFRQWVMPSYKMQPMEFKTINGTKLI